MPEKRIRRASSYAELPQAKKDRLNAQSRERRKEKRKRENELITVPIEQDNSLYDIFSTVIRTDGKQSNTSTAIDIPNINETPETSTIGTLKTRSFSLFWFSFTCQTKQKKYANICTNPILCIGLNPTAMTLFEDQECMLSIILRQSSRKKNYTNSNVSIYIPS